LNADDQERAAVLIAFNEAHLLPQLMSDPRVGCALLLHRVLVTQLVEKESANAIVLGALLLPGEHCQKVLSALDIRGALTTIEVERTSIDDALKGAKDHKRLPFSF
jgi:hypothetical protein